MVYIYNQQLLSHLSFQSNLPTSTPNQMKLSTFNPAEPKENTNLSLKKMFK